MENELKASKKDDNFIYRCLFSFSFPFYHSRGLGLAMYLEFYNERRRHQGLDDRTPDEVYWRTLLQSEGSYPDDHFYLLLRFSIMLRFVAYLSLDTRIIFSAFISVSRKLSGGKVVAEKAFPAMPSIMSLKYMWYLGKLQKSSSAKVSISFTGHSASCAPNLKLPVVPQFPKMGNQYLLH